MGRPSSFALVFLAGFVGPLVLFAILATQVSGGSVPGWDESLMRFLHGIGEPPVPTGTQRLVDNSTAAGAIVLGGLLLALVAGKRLRDALFVTAAVLGIGLLEPLLKSAFERQPPGDAEGFSFPSGSAMASMAIVAALSFLAWQTRVRWLVALGGSGIVLGFGAAIVTLRWHYPSDVLAGWCIALAWVSGVWLVRTRLASPERRVSTSRRSRTRAAASHSVSPSRRASGPV
jgi:membrane-associated phospholipid phosphatase